MNHPKTTSQILKQTTFTILTHLPILILLSTLTFSLRSNVEFATNSLTSFIDHDPSIKSIISRLHLSSHPPPSPFPHRRRRPFLQLTRVGTLDDDFFSGDDDLDHRFFGTSDLKSVNYTDLIVDRFHFGNLVTDYGFRVSEFSRLNFKLVNSIPVDEKFVNSVEKLANSVIGDEKLVDSVVVDDKLVKSVAVGASVAVNEISVKSVANSVPIEEKLVNSVAVDEKLVNSAAVDEKLVKSINSAEKLATSLSIDENVASSVATVNSAAVDEKLVNSDAVDEKLVKSVNSVDNLVKSVAVDGKLVNSGNGDEKLVNSAAVDKNSVYSDNSAAVDEKLVNSVAFDEKLVNSVEKLAISSNSVAVDEKFVNSVNGGEKFVNSVAVDEKFVNSVAVEEKYEKLVKSVEEGIREEVRGENELEMFLKRFEIEKNEMSALLFLLGVLLASYVFAIFGFVVTYAWVLGIVFVVVVNDLLKGDKSLVRMLWEGSNLGLKRLSGFIVMRWAVKDVLTQLLGVWFFGESEDQYLFFKIFVRLKLMPFSIVLPWVEGFDKEIYGFLLSWFLLDTLVSFVFAVDAWIVMVDTRKSVREVVKEGCHLLSLMLHPAINLKCLEGIVCGSFARWVLSQLFGKLFASAFQSFMEVYFMVAWLLYYFSVKSIDADSSGVVFGHRELEQLLEDVR